MCPRAVEQLNIDKADQLAIHQYITTVHGIKPEEIFNIKGLLVSSLAGDTPIRLENAQMNVIPLMDVTQDIPTPEEVSAIPGLSHLAHYFPKKNDGPQFFS